MNIIVCVDDNFGMLFNHRRVSSDEKVLDKIREIAGEHLWIREFSKTIFPTNVQLDQKMLDEAASGDFCFVEDISVSDYMNQIEKLYIFHWNRNYPSDFKFDLDISNNFILEQIEEFEGKSHEKITMEVYRHVSLKK